MFPFSVIHLSTKPLEVKTSPGGPADSWCYTFLKLAMHTSSLTCRNCSTSCRQGARTVLFGSFDVCRCVLSLYGEKHQGWQFRAPYQFFLARQHCMHVHNGAISGVVVGRCITVKMSHFIISGKQLKESILPVDAVQTHMICSCTIQRTPKRKIVDKLNAELQKFKR